jgi:hypothetical protein
MAAVRRLAAESRLQRQRHRRCRAWNQPRLRVHSGSAQCRALFNGQCRRLAGMPQPAQPHHPGGNQHSRGHNIRGVKDGPAGRTGAGLLKPAAQPAVQAQLTDTHGEQADQRHRLGPSRNMPVPNWPRRSALLRTRRLPSRGTWAAGLRHRLPASRHSRSSGRAGCDQENTGRQREGAQESAAIKVHPAPSLSAV